MVRIQDFHSWHTSSILVESTRDYNADWDKTFTLRVANHCISLSTCIKTHNRLSNGMTNICVLIGKTDYIRL